MAQPPQNQRRRSFSGVIWGALSHNFWRLALVAAIVFAAVWPDIALAGLQNVIGVLAQAVGPVIAPLVTIAIVIWAIKLILTKAK